jgi:hypothetical protein
MCELYCKEDAIYVGPDRDQREPVNEAEVVSSGLLGQFRRDSGWDEWENDPQHENQIWQLGPYIQAGGKRSVERVQKRIAERERRAATPVDAVPEPAK